MQKNVSYNINLETSYAVKFVLQDTLLLKRNFCGPEEYYVSLMNYKPATCVPKQGGLSSIAFAAVPDSLLLCASLLFVGFVVL